MKFCVLGTAENGMTIHQINPLQDSRWEELLHLHPKASVFHTRGWLEALRATYGYTPLAFTTAAPGEALKNGIAFCQIESWVTGRRMVSLPFSDHCEPLLEKPEGLTAFLPFLESQLKTDHWKYFELRPLIPNALDGEAPGHLGKGEEFSLHRLDLRPDLDKLFARFHKSCVQRKIRKAENERLGYEEGRSEELLMKFYNLLLITRRRHQLPPQPLNWFRNLIKYLGEKLSIRVASKDGRPIASILTLAYKDSLLYKYGCSDEKYNNFGGSVYLFWRAIQEAKQLGACEFDFGRSELSNAGLIAFKMHWGASESHLVYFRFPAPPHQTVGQRPAMQFAKYIFGHMPDRLLTTAGRVLYRHMG